MEKIEMILFDLDGTLWNPLDTTLKTVNEVLENNKLNIRVSKETVESGMGSTSYEVAKMYMPTLNEEKRLELFREMEKNNCKKLLQCGGVLYPELEKVLKILKKKYKLAIVSNCGDNYIESFLEHYNFGKYFDDYMAASKYGISKGEAINRVLERNNINNAIYVGDTQKDFEATKEAGIPFIYAKYGFGKVNNNQYCINNLLELKELLK